MFAVIYVPNFFLQAALRHRPELRSRPVGLIDSEFPKPFVFQINRAAAQRGVVEGQTATQARARCREIALIVVSRVQTQTATDVLLQTAYAFSPNIEMTAPGVCTMGLKGLGLRTQTEVHIWATNIIQALLHCDLDGRIGLAATPALALVAARQANPMLCVNDSDEFISRLPLQILDLPAETFAILSRWGIRTAGEFLALGQNKVVERLGQPALELFVRIAPDFVRPLKLVLPSAEYAEQIEFEHEIETAQPLLFVLRRFVEQMSRRLEMIHLVVSEFDLCLGLASGGSHKRTFKIPSPTARIETLFRILHTHLEDLRTDSPVVSLRLAAKPTRPDTHQLGLFETTLRDPNQFAETLAWLTALCGADCAGSPVLERTHRPDAFRMKIPDFSTHWNGKSQANHLRGLPLRRYRPAISAAVEFREERPTLLHSQPVTAPIVHFRGPFRSSGDWWDKSRWAREEWDVQTSNGALYRIFRSQGQCFVEGVYD